MVNNFDLISSFLKFESEDDFYFIQVIQRKKEHKELGFDEPCFNLYDFRTKQLMYKIPNIGEAAMFKCDNHNKTNHISALTFSQAFRWFREKYFLDAEIYLNHELGHKFYYYLILQLVRENIEWKSRNITKFKTYEEAELACLIKLIEIVKNNN